MYIFYIAHMLQLTCEMLLVHIVTTVYSQVLIYSQLSELEQCRVKTLAQGFNTAAQNSNPGSRSRESDALPLSHYALHNTKVLERS